MLQNTDKHSRSQYSTRGTCLLQDLLYNIEYWYMAFFIRYKVLHTSYLDYK